MRTTREILDEHVDPNDPPETRGEPITVEVKSQLDEHHLHSWEPTETLVDNPIEFTRWGYCNTCQEEFMVKSVTWVHR